MMFVGPFQLRVFHGSVDVHEGRALELSLERELFFRQHVLFFPMVRGALSQLDESCLCFCYHCRSRKLHLYLSYVLPGPGTDQARAD